MNHLEQAIIDANVSGGYRKDVRKVFMRGGELRWQYGDYTERVDIAATLLDPLFWQALGKARKWKHSGYVQFYEKLTKVGRTWVKETDIESWKLARYMLTDHTEKKDAESFFATLV